MPRHFASDLPRPGALAGATFSVAVLGSAVPAVIVPRADARFAWVVFLGSPDLPSLTHPRPGRGDQAAEHHG